MQERRPRGPRRTTRPAPTRHRGPRSTQIADVPEQDEAARRGSYSVPAPPAGATAWRWPLIAASLVAAAAHVPVTAEHLREAAYIGVLFVLLEVACALLAIALLRRATRPVLAAVAVVGGLAVLALVVSRTIGLPLIGDDVGAWTEPLAVVSLVAESIMLVGGVVAARGAMPASRTALRIGAAAGLVVLVGGALAIGLAVRSAGAAEPAEHGTTGHRTPMDGSDMPGMDMHDMEGM